MSPVHLKCCTIHPPYFHIGFGYTLLSSPSMGVRGWKEHLVFCSRTFQQDKFFLPQAVLFTVCGLIVIYQHLKQPCFLSDNSPCGEAGITPLTHPNSRPRNRSILGRLPPMNLLWQSVSGLVYQDFFCRHRMRFTPAIYPLMPCPPTTLPPTVLLLLGGNK